MNDKRRIRCICILYAREFKSRKSTVWAFFQGKRRLIDKRNLNFRKATERVGIFLNRITYRDCIFLIIKLALSHRIVIRCCPILRKNLYLVFNQMPWKFVTFFAASIYLINQAKVNAIRIATWMAKTFLSIFRIDDVHFITINNLLIWIEYTFEINMKCKTCNHLPIFELFLSQCKWIRRLFFE